MLMLFFCFSKKNIKKIRKIKNGSKMDRETKDAEKNKGPK
jgi:hypothetical protein